MDQTVGLHWNFQWWIFFTESRGQLIISPGIRPNAADLVEHFLGRFEVDERICVWFPGSGNRSIKPLRIDLHHVFGLFVAPRYLDHLVFRRCLLLATGWLLVIHWKTLVIADASRWIEIYSLALGVLGIFLLLFWLFIFCAFHQILNIYEFIFFLYIFKNA